MHRAWVKLLSCGLVAVVLAVAGYRAWSSHPVFFDDAYITYRYAQNLVAGHGPVYNVDERVEGYTNFSWMLLVAAGMRAGWDPLSVSRAAGLFCHMAMLALIGWLGTAWLLRQGWSRAWLLPPVFVLLVRPQAFAAMAGCGLETPLVTALLVANAALLACGDFSRWPARAALAVGLSLAVLTRMDSLIAVGAAVLALAWTPLRAHQGVRAAVRSALWPTLPVLGVLAIWTVWRLVYYGDVLPNTFYAKAAAVSHTDAGLAYFKALNDSYPEMLPLLVLCVAGLGVSDPKLQRMAVFANITLAIEIAYTVRVGGDFMEYRFAWQQYGLLVLGALVGLSAVATKSWLSGMAVVCAALSVSGQTVRFEHGFGMQSLDEMDGYAHTGTQVGKKLGQLLPHEVIVSTTLAGTIAYYSKLEVIDQWGLNDHFVAHEPMRGFIRGHVKFAPLGYLRSRGVNLYIEHPVTCSCSSPCRERKPNVFVRLGDGRCLRTWYLVQREKLTHYFCDHPESFVLSRVRCPKPPPPPRAAAPAAPPARAAAPAPPPQPRARR